MSNWISAIKIAFWLSQRTIGGPKSEKQRSQSIGISHAILTVPTIYQQLRRISYFCTRYNALLLSGPRD
jgi:hypothetical protein